MKCFSSSLSAYASLIGEPHVLQQSLSSLGVTDLFSGQTEGLVDGVAMETTHTMGTRTERREQPEGVSSLLLEYEQQISHPLNSLGITQSWHQKSEKILSLEFLEMLRSESM